MCGIVAYYSSNITESNEIEVVSSLNKMKHRGLVTEIKKINNKCILGTRRLPIIDLEKGIQPFTNETEDVFVVFNGEIYNYEILIKDLKGKGHKFKSECDTEVIVHLWEEYRKRILYYIEGMFSIIIYDKRTDTLFAARDHIGIKPLYIFQSNKETIMCSEIKAFPKEKLKNIFELYPSSFYLNGKTYCYFSNSNLNVIKNPNSHQTLVSLITNSVKREVKTKLPICVFYSGGIDSTIILELAQRYHPNVTAITVGFEGSDDIKIAKDYCQTKGINHIVRTISETEILNNLNKIIYYLESFEPNLVRAAVFTYFMAETARNNGFKVALSGEGSDEIFYGYKDFLKNSYAQADMLGDSLTNDLFRTQLHRLDRCTMAHTIETRVPFLDNNVINFARKLPVDCKLNGKPYENKKILREAFFKIVGKQISERPKNPMDEGAIPGGKRPLNDIFNSLTKEIKIPANYQKSYNLTHGFLKEETYYLNAFLEYGFDNEISKKRIKVRTY